jgi:hypothetical protein
MMAQKRISILADNKFISKGGILLSSIGVLLFTVLGLGGCKNVDKKSPQQVFHYNSSKDPMIGDLPLGVQGTERAQQNSNGSCEGKSYLHIHWWQRRCN